MTRMAAVERESKTTCAKESRRHPNIGKKYGRKYNLQIPQGGEHEVEKLPCDAREVALAGFPEQDVLLHYPVLPLHPVVGGQPNVETLVVARTPHLKVIGRG